MKFQLQGLYILFLPSCNQYAHTHSTIKTVAKWQSIKFWLCHMTKFWSSRYNMMTKYLFFLCLSLTHTHTHEAMDVFFFSLSVVSFHNVYQKVKLDGVPINFLTHDQVVPRLLFATL